jgi:hypothetical protein
VLDTAGILISDTLGWQANPAVCRLGPGFLVAWQMQSGDNSIYAARVTSAGVVLDTGGFPVAAPGEECEPAVAYDGTNALVAWTDYASGADLRGARVTPAGTVLDSSGFLIAGADEGQEFVEMAFDGTNYVLAWEDYRNNTWVGDIYAARVTPGAQVLDPNGIPVLVDTLYERSPALASGNSVSLVLWTGWPPPDLEADVQMKRVSAAGVVLDSAATSVATYCPYQWNPAVAFDGTNYLVVWEDDRTNAAETDIYAARISPTGQNLDPAGIPVCVEDGWQDYPAVAFDGVNYVVAWQDERDGQPDIYAARVTPTGQLVDTQAIQVAWESGDDERYPTVVAGDTVTLVAWEYERRDIEGRRINRNGQVLDPDIIDISPDERGRYPAAAFDGTDFLVVFEDDRDDTVDIFGTRVGQDGTVLNAEFRISVGDTAEECEPRAAFDGSNYLVVWQTERPGNWEMHATRLTPGCVVLDSPSIVVAQTGRSGSDADPDVVFSGTDFVVVWEDMRNNPETTDIYGARVSTGGQVLEQFAAVRQPASQYVPRLARGPGSQLLLVYEGWTTTYQGRPFNTDHIWGKLPPLAGVEETRSAAVRREKAGATIVRGVLFLGAGHDPNVRHSGSCPKPALLDVSGRKVLDLHPNANNVSRLSPGVYFVREQSAVSSQHTATNVRKVIVVR